MGDSDRPGLQAAGLAGLTGAGVMLATFAGFDADGRFLVALEGRGEPVPALSTVGLGAEDLGQRIAIAFEGGDPSRPIILGRARATPAPARLDGERLVLRAEREIELRCGEASIVLTCAGKVLIRGNYVLSRSRGANKIKGAYVDIN